MRARAARARLEAEGPGALRFTTPRGHGWRGLAALGLAFACFMPMCYVVAGGVGRRDAGFESFMAGVAAWLLALTAVIAAGGYLAFRDQVVVIDRYRQIVAWRPHRRVPERRYWYHEVAGLEVGPDRQNQVGSWTGSRILLAVLMLDGTRVDLGTFQAVEADRSDLEALVARLAAETELPVFDMRAGNRYTDVPAWRQRALQSRVRADLPIDDGNPAVLRLGGVPLAAQAFGTLVLSIFPLVVFTTIVALVFEQLGLRTHGPNYEGPMDPAQGRALTTTLVVGTLVIWAATGWLVRRSCDTTRLDFDLRAREVSYREGTLHARRTVGFDRVLALAGGRDTPTAHGDACLELRLVGGRRVKVAQLSAGHDLLARRRWLAERVSAATGIPFEEDGAPGRAAG